MIDFKDEINKYKPVLSVDEVESVVGGEVKDMMDLLQYITKQITGRSDDADYTTKE